MNSNEFLLDSGFWGFLYKILTPVEWLQTWIMKIVHDFFVMLGVSPIGVSWVLAIIILVLVVQACIFPLFYKQMKSMRKMQALAPKMQRIQNKYKGKTDQASREAMSRETMKLYQDNDVNPAGSCLPMLIQGPVFMSMFYTLSAIPYIAQTDVFGIVSVTDNFTSAAASGKAVIGIFVFLMCFCLWFMQYFSMKRNMAAASMNKQTETMQKAMLWLFPVMYIFSGVAMPFAVLVYWLTNNVCNLCRTLWQVYAFPTPGSPAAADKEKRDHRNENARRAKAGLPSLEEEALAKAKEEAERKATQGYQRQQPVRKRKKK